MTAQTRNQEIAATIAQQLGGIGRLSTMCGARDFVAVEDGLRMKLGSGATGKKGMVTHLTVTLTPEDLYDVKTQRVRGGTVTDLETVEGIFADMLMNTFEAMTGMYLTFNARRA